MLESKVLISKPYFVNEGQYTHYDKLYDMLKEDSDFFTIDKVVRGTFGGINQLYFHFDLKNENGDTQTIYMSTQQGLDMYERDDWFCNGGFDSDAAYNEQPNGEHYRDDDGNLHTYPRYITPYTSWDLRAGRITREWCGYGLPHTIYIVYNENMFYYNLLPNIYLYGDYYNERNTYDLMWKNSIVVTTTNPLGSLNGGVFWGGGVDYTYSLRIGDDWYHKNDNNNSLYNRRQVAHRNSVGANNQDSYIVGNLTASAPVTLISNVDADGNRLWSMAGTTNVQFTVKHYCERNRDDDDKVYNSIHYYGGKKFVECEITLDNQYQLIVSECGEVKYV